jgi:hypothetical protein
MNTHIALLGMTLAVGAFATTALADEEEHFDVWLRLVEETLVTGAISEDEAPLDPFHRVFGAELGEDPKEPFASDEPGFQLVNESVEPGTTFHVAFTGAVDRWNGAGFESAAETVTFEFGPLSMTSGDGRIEGFDFAADDLGGFHNHFEIILNAPPGPADPADGVYLIPVAMSGTDGAFGESDVFWFVMNLNRPEEEHEAATEWVEENRAAPDVCHIDFDSSGAVDTDDLVEVIAGWGACEMPAGFECPGDVLRDGVVDVRDLVDVLGAWGPCP